VFPAIETIKRLRRKTGKRIQASQVMIDAWDAYEGLNEQVKALEKEAKAHKARALAELGNAEEAELLNRVLTYRPQTKRSLKDADEFERRHPAIFDECVKVTTFPVARCPKEKP
jgi:hypothetical protein